MSADDLPVPQVDKVAYPAEKERAILACRMYVTGHDLPDCAETAGVSVPTLRKWLTCSWWADIERLCVIRYGQMLAHKVRGAVERLVDARDPATVRWAGDRVVPEFAPPQQRIDHSGEVLVDFAEEARQVLLDAIAKEEPDEEENG